MTYILSPVPTPSEIDAAPQYDEDMCNAIPYQHIVAAHREHFAAMGLFDLRDERRGGQCLGIGSYGVAFGVSDTEVLKLTRDRDEAIASQLLIGRRSAHLPEVRRVFDMPLTHLRGEGWDRWYVIIRERLVPLAGLERQLMNLCWQIYTRIDRLEIPQSDQMMDRWRGYLKAQEISQVDLQRCIQMLRRVSAGQKELAALGLQWGDMHEDNIMRRRSGELVIADLGHAEWISARVSVKMDVLLPRLRERDAASA